MLKCLNEMSVYEPIVTYLMCQCISCNLQWALNTCRAIPASVFTSQHIEFLVISRLLLNFLTYGQYGTVR